MPAEQRTALVTGGNGGLGAAIARALHDAGHTVLVIHSPGNSSIGAWLEAQAGEGYSFIAYSSQGSKVHMLVEQGQWIAQAVQLGFTFLVGKQAQHQQTPGGQRDGDFTRR